MPDVMWIIYNIRFTVTQLRASCRPDVLRDVPEMSRARLECPLQYHGFLAEIEHCLQSSEL
jgi:hypothetical protein